MRAQSGFQNLRISSGKLWAELESWDERNWSLVVCTTEHILIRSIYLKNSFPLKWRISTVDEAENQINDWDYKEAKTSNQHNKREKIQKNEDSISSLWDNFKCTNICILGVPEGQEREQEIGNLLENIMTENSPNLVKEIAIQVQEAQRAPNKRNIKRSTLSHSIIRM